MDRFIDRYLRDRRIATRHNLRAPLRFRIRKSPVPEQGAEIENLSETGVLFATDSSMKVGIAVDLLLRMPREITGREVTEWSCTGHVVRVVPPATHGQNLRVGVAFDFYEIRTI